MDTLFVKMSVTVINFAREFYITLNNSDYRLHTV